MLKIFEQFSLVMIYAGIVQGFFVAFLLNSKGVTRSRANLFLSVLLIALSFSITHIVYAGRLFDHLTLKIYSVGDPTFFLIAPLIWFYTLELTSYRVNFSWQRLAHFLPFLLVIIFSLTFRSTSDDDVTKMLYSSRRISNVIFWIAVVLQFSCYQFFIHKKWAAYQVFMQREVSNTENVNISWVRFFMGVFLLVNVFFLFSLFAVIHLQSREWLGQAVALTFSLSIFALGYKGILQKDIFDTVLHQHNDTAKVNIKKESIRDDGLVNKVNEFMRDKKPYLDPELTLTTLARELSLNRSELSQLINEGIGDNFYNFVNKYRVEEVKRLMVDSSFKNYNMLGLAMEAGFKSKSTFNLIFKRFTGLTPTEYRRNLSE